MSKAIGAKCGHVKRRLLLNEPLKGKVLEFALSLFDENPSALGERGDRIAKKLAAGQSLDDYELHLMVDVLLPHRRLAG